MSVDSTMSLKATIKLSHVLVRFQNSSKPLGRREHTVLKENAECCLISFCLDDPGFLMFWTFPCIVNWDSTLFV